MNKSELDKKKKYIQNLFDSDKIISMEFVDSSDGGVYSDFSGDEISNGIVLCKFVENGITKELKISKNEFGFFSNS